MVEQSKEWRRLRWFDIWIPLSEVNNGSGLTLGGSSIVPGRVIVTPLTSISSPAPVNTPVRPLIWSVRSYLKRLSKGVQRFQDIHFEKYQPWQGIHYTQAWVCRQGSVVRYYGYTKGVIQQSKEWRRLHWFDIWIPLSEVNNGSGVDQALCQGVWLWSVLERPIL